MRGLKGKRVLITGGAQGIGAAAAKRFLEEGARVAILDKDSDASLQIEASLPGIEQTIIADVSEAGLVAAAFDLLDDLANILEPEGIGIDFAGNCIDVVAGRIQYGLHKWLGAAAAQVIYHDRVQPDAAGKFWNLEHLLACLADTADDEVADKEHGQVPDRGKAFSMVCRLNPLLRNFRV